MRDGLLIRWRGPGEVLEWLRIEGGRAGFVQREQRPAASVLDKAARIAVLVPAEDVLSIGLDLPAKKPEAARKAAAFAAEEQVAAPIESVHVALAEAANDGRWPCAVIAKPKLAALQADLAQRGIAADAVHADAACLGAGRSLRSGAHRAFDLRRHFGCMAGGAQPVQPGDTAGAVDIDFEHTDGVELRRQLALEDARCIQAVQVLRRILAIVFGVACARGRRQRWRAGGRASGRVAGHPAVGRRGANRRGFTRRHQRRRGSHQARQQPGAAPGFGGGSGRGLGHGVGAAIYRTS